jgi:hypothetical protein
VSADLFNEPVVPRVETPAARNTDPETSHEAAEAITASGVRHRQAKDVARAVRFYPGRTSAEIAALLMMQRHIPARRLPELETGGVVERGPKRKCTVAGTNAITWWPRGWRHGAEAEAKDTAGDTAGRALRKTAQQEAACAELAEVDMLRATLRMIANAFYDWQEPTPDAGREWCQRISTYLRGNVAAIAEFTPEQWAEIKKWMTPNVPAKRDQEVRAEYNPPAQEGLL